MPAKLNLAAPAAAQRLRTLTHDLQHLIYLSMEVWVMT